MTVIFLNYIYIISDFNEISDPMINDPDDAATVWLTFLGFFPFAYVFTRYIV